VEGEGRQSNAQGKWSLLINLSLDEVDAEANGATKLFWSGKVEKSAPVSVL
jgi:hypothetical protein